MYEPRHEEPIPLRRFVRRLSTHGAVAVALVVISLAIGMTGYMYFEHMRWRDAFVNAAMLLGGMGPVDPLKTNGGKIFAGCYALYCGVVFLVTAGILFAPIVHRMLHRFSWRSHGTTRAG